MTDVVTLLSELDALAEKATPGPWKADTKDNVGDNWLLGCFLDLGEWADDDGSKYSSWILTTDRVRASELSGGAGGDAHYIAALVNAYPLLRAEILRLREALEIRAGEVAWLVEISDGASPQYLTLQHEPLSKWPPPTWSPDPNKALRFARKEDAERWSCAFRLDDELVGARAIEHAWISP